MAFASGEFLPARDCGRLAAAPERLSCRWAIATMTELQHKLGTTRAYAALEASLMQVK